MSYLYEDDKLKKLPIFNAVVSSLILGKIIITFYQEQYFLLDFLVREWNIEFYSYTTEIKLISEIWLYILTYTLWNLFLYYILILNSFDMFNSKVFVNRASKIIHNSLYLAVPALVFIAIATICTSLFMFFLSFHISVELDLVNFRDLIYGYLPFLKFNLLIFYLLFLDLILYLMFKNYLRSYKMNIDMNNEESLDPKIVYDLNSLVKSTKVSFGLCFVFICLFGLAELSVKLQAGGVTSSFNNSSPDVSLGIQMLFLQLAYLVKSIISDYNSKNGHPIKG